MDRTQSLADRCGRCQWHRLSGIVEPSACSSPTPGQSRQRSAPSPATASPWTDRPWSCRVSAPGTRPFAWRLRFPPPAVRHGTPVRSRRRDCRPRSRNPQRAGLAVLVGRKQNGSPQDGLCPRRDCWHCTGLDEARPRGAAIQECRERAVEPALPAKQLEKVTKRAAKSGVVFAPGSCVYSCRHTFAKRTLGGFWTGKPATIEQVAGLLGNCGKFAGTTTPNGVPLIPTPYGTPWVVTDPLPRLDRRVANHAAVHDLMTKHGNSPERSRPRRA